MKIKKFKDIEKDSVKVGVDIKSFEGDKELTGFKSENDEVTKKQEKDIKSKIQITTPGLKKSIKKFEEFSLEVIEVEDDGEEYDDDDNFYSYDGCGCCPACNGQKDCKCGCPECDSDIKSELCNLCDCKMCKCNENNISYISEGLKYHLDNKISIIDNIYRPGSENFYGLIKETRNLFDSDRIVLSVLDRNIYESTDIGRFGHFNGDLVPLDLPMENLEELNEAEYKGKEVELNHPMRNKGKGKKYYVYVKDPKTGKVKKISFGDKKGGLTAKVSDPEARKSFAARHKCPTKKDKTKPGYWACRVNRYGHLWNNKSYPGFW